MSDSEKRRKECMNCKFCNCAGIACDKCDCNMIDGDETHCYCYMYVLGHITDKKCKHKEDEDGAGEM